MLKLSKLEAAYLAGILDGEGCICLINDDGYYIPHVDIAQKNGPFINWLQKLTQLGSVHRKINGVFYWRLSSNAIREFLPIVLPYMRIKTPQARLLLHYLEKYKTRPPWPLKQWEWDYKYQCYHDMKMLNKK